jgi:uncharacterized membrane-anchored protein
MMTSWKKERMTLLQKKGDLEMIGDGQPISITDCADRILACLSARAFQDINARYGAFTDFHTDFIKNTSGCREDGVMLNELFLNAPRGHESLVMIAIDFTNALVQSRTS